VESDCATAAEGDAAAAAAAAEEEAEGAWGACASALRLSSHRRAHKVDRATLLAYTLLATVLELNNVRLYTLQATVLDQRC
jgi:hypothetical protein